MLLRLLGKDDVAALGHNSPAYVHLVAEAVKLACADREAYFGDPRFIDVPVAQLLSPQFQAGRRELIDPARAFPELRAPATIEGHPCRVTADVPREREPALSPDTTYCAVIDGAGNVFSATPSDASYDAELIPGTGLVPSGRGSQSWTVAGHASEIMPLKRPRLTPNPAIAVLENGRALMPFGTPGGDVQTQAMLQVLLNLTAFGMDLRTAIEAPRFASYAFPSSFEPHEAYPNRLAIEGRIEPASRDGLRALGHDLLDWPDWTRLAGTVCAVIKDDAAGVLTAAADPRRAAYAVGW
jgi:gamma-glutamyltranspeptidase/glutathione hydrolase